MSVLEKKKISWFEVRKNKKTDIMEFRRTVPVELLKLTAHELIVLVNDQKVAYPSNYNLIQHAITNHDFIILAMFAYRRATDLDKKLYPLPLKNKGFNEGLAWDHFANTSPENLQEILLNDDEINALIDESRRLKTDLQNLLKFTDTLTNKQAEIVNTILGDKDSTSIVSKTESFEQNIPILDADEKDGEIHILSH
ncbi:MAG: hypothetical protein GF364_13075, partial [Candidatus Lokiarchaeota archaeon]|nr:hypothetical protein [Candidatus Lokiarchaeota archaeon]